MRLHVNGVERVIDVPEPRLAVLEKTPDLFLATHLLVQES
jgi:hypothetical protein